jgi:hypothetical protein
MTGHFAFGRWEAIAGKPLLRLIFVQIHELSRNADLVA